MAKALEDLEEEYTFNTGAQNLKDVMKDLSRRIRRTMTAELGVPIMDMSRLIARTRKQHLEYDVFDKYWGALESCLFELTCVVQRLANPRLSLSDKEEKRREWCKLCVNCRQYYNRLLEIEPDPAAAQIELNRAYAKRDEENRMPPK